MQKPALRWMFWRQRRYVVAIMLFLGFFNVYSLRVNLSISIVPMIYGYKGETGKGFDWNSKQQGLALSSFFYGYICTQFIGGVCANKVGGRRLFGLGILCTALLTLLSPLAAKAGLGYFIALRALEGIFEGVTYPSLHAIWSKWAPTYERSQLNSFAFSGSYIGTVVMMPFLGWIAETYGWEAVFYLTGVLGCLWYIFWLILVKESPETDPYISEEERKYICESLGKGDTNKSEEQTDIPWKAIFTSKAVYAIVAANFSENWGFYTLLTQLPTFLKDTTKLNLETSGFISGLPYLVMAIMLIPSGFLADFCQNKGYLTTTQVRRYFNCGGFVSQTVFMLLAAYLAHPLYSIMSLVVAVGLGAFSISGFAVNHLDIAPQFSSILMGISNTAGTVPGILSPIITGYIVQHKSQQEWNIVFIIAASIYMVGCVIYWFFASGELQPWAKAKTLEIQMEIPSPERIKPQRSDSHS